MIRRVTLRSLAKLNLDLRVLHKRADGFHELRTVFQSITLSDRLIVEYEPSRRTLIETLVHVDGQKLNIPGNLVTRAAELLLDAMKTKARVRFNLFKNIPMGGGLGGGSSNAAAVLLALPVLARKRMPLEQLAEIGAQLGSDVPFFLNGGTALALGKGTEIYPLKDVKPEPILLVVPAVHVSTAEAYQKLGRKLTSPETSRKLNLFQLYVEMLASTGSAKLAGPVSSNDFEPAVFSQFPQLKTIHGKLRSHAPVARMTGSGSALFAIFGSEAEREKAQTDLEKIRMFQKCRVVEASLVSRGTYQRLWRRQLREHLAPSSSIWPPPSRYAR